MVTGDTSEPAASTGNDPVPSVFTEEPAPWTEGPLCVWCRSVVCPAIESVGEPSMFTEELAGNGPDERSEKDVSKPRGGPSMFTEEPVAVRPAWHFE